MNCYNHLCIISIGEIEMYWYFLSVTQAKLQKSWEKSNFRSLSQLLIGERKKYVLMKSSHMRRFLCKYLMYSRTPLGTPSFTYRRRRHLGKSILTFYGRRLWYQTSLFLLNSDIIHIRLFNLFSQEGTLWNRIECFKIKYYATPQGMVFPNKVVRKQCWKKIMIFFQNSRASIFS